MSPGACCHPACARSLRALARDPILTLPVLAGVGAPLAQVPCTKHFLSLSLRCPFCKRWGLGWAIPSSLPRHCPGPRPGSVPVSSAEAPGLW